MINLSRLCFAAIFSAIILHCKNYNLDEKIQNALNPASTSALQATTGSTSGGTLAGNTITMAFANGAKFQLQLLVSGGRAPYNYAIDLNQLPGYALASVDSNGLVQVGRNLGTGIPVTVANNLANLGSFSVRVSDASNQNFSLSFSVQVTYKRVFVTTDGARGDFNTNATGVFISCGGTGYSKVNCVCQASAQGAGLPNAQKYRAYVSQGPTQLAPVQVAKCNIAGKSFVSGQLVQVTNAGSGYTSAPSVSVTGGSCAGGAFQANVTNGKVTDIQVISPLTGCASYAQIVSITGGGGSGATANFEFGGCSVKPTDGGPWYRTDGNIVATDMSFGPGGLFQGTIANPILLTQTGAAGGVNALTGTTTSGYASASDCTQWTNAGTGTYGDQTLSTTQWVDHGPGGCTGVNWGVYCFEGD